MAEQTVNTEHVELFLAGIPTEWTAEQATVVVAKMRRAVGSPERPMVKTPRGPERVNTATMVAAIDAIAQRFGVQG